MNATNRWSGWKIVESHQGFLGPRFGVYRTYRAGFHEFYPEDFWSLEEAEKLAAYLNGQVPGLWQRAAA